MADASGSQLVDLLPGIDKKRRQGQSKARKSGTQLLPSTKEARTARKRDVGRVVFNPLLAAVLAQSTIDSFTRNKLMCYPSLTNTSSFFHLFFSCHFVRNSTINLLFSLVRLSSSSISSSNNNSSLSLSVYSLFLQFPCSCHVDLNPTDCL